MRNWETFVAGGKQAVKLNDPISKLIVRTLGADLGGFFAKTDAGKTRHIMDALSLLGDSGLNQQFKVLSNKFTLGLKPKNGDFLRKEWLYDLHWFTDPGGYKLTRLPLVVECEWQWIRKDDTNVPKDRYGEVKWDFQKLLVANAELRLMIFRQRPSKNNREVNEDLDVYFDNVIDGYTHLMAGSKFLFIAFDKDGFRYTQKVKSI